MEYLLILGVIIVVAILQLIVSRLNGLSNTIAYMQRDGDIRWRSMGDRLSNLEKWEK